jgi:hypothetical protein
LKKSYWQNIGEGFNSSSGESWKVILFCLFIATTFWFFNALNKADYSTRLAFPIEISFNDELYMAVKEPPKELRVDVSGGGWDLLRRSLGFDLAPIKIALDNPSNISFLLGDNFTSQITDRLSELRVNFVVDDTLPLQIERIETRSLALLLDTFNLDIAENVVINYPVLFEPDSIQVRGPSSFVNALPNSLYINPELGSIADDFDAEVSVGTLGSRLYQLSPDRVKMKLSVTKFERFSQEVSLTSQGFPSEYGLNNELVEVSYSAPSNSFPLALIYPWEIVVNFREFDPSDSTVAVLLKSSPEFVKDISINPDRVKITKK